MKQQHFLIVFIAVFISVHGHGRLMDPPSRNAMWRFGFPNPVNYNDNEVFCGGAAVQHEKNGGKCGVCGDDYNQDQPRDHEMNGIYGNGIIGRRYVMGQKIDVEVELTTNHMGTFTLKLCPLNSKNRISTDECFDKYPLRVVGTRGSTTYVIPPDTPRKAILNYQVYLPKGLTCQQCAMQWTYRTGNTWGKCKNGTQGLGCGPQETFRNCADIAIHTSTAAFPNTTALQEFPYAIYFKDASDGKSKPYVVRNQLCVATEAFAAKDLYADQWCTINCLKYPPKCPPEKCTCISGCRAIGELADIEGTHVYCQRNCFKNSAPECMLHECECYGPEGEPIQRNYLDQPIFRQELKDDEVEELRTKEIKSENNSSIEQSTFEQTTFEQDTESLETTTFLYTSSLQKSEEKFETASVFEQNIAEHTKVEQFTNEEIEATTDHVETTTL